MKYNIFREKANSLPRVSVTGISALLAVLSVSLGLPHVDAWADGDSSWPAATPEDAESAIGRSGTPDSATDELDAAAMARWTVDGGGGVTCTGGGYELSGTVGQPDVGLASGGDLTLSGGFWFPLSDGDCNTDGGVDLIDFSGFHPCLSGPGGGVRRDCRCFDVDQDADVDLSDVAAFQQAFTGG